MWGWDDRPGGAGSWRLSQHDEATASTAKIIPLRPWFDPPPSRDEDPYVKFADDVPVEIKSADAKTAEPASVEPFRREKAKADVKTEAGAEVRTEAKAESKTEAKTPPPGSTVVIEQAVPAPPLRTAAVWQMPAATW